MAEAKIIPFKSKRSIAGSAAITQVGIAINPAGQVISLTNRVDPLHALAVLDFLLRAASNALDQYIDAEHG